MNLNTSYDFSHFSEHTVKHNLRSIILTNSFIPDISIAPLQDSYYSEALPTTALILCRN